MNKRKNLLNMVFGTILSLGVIAACSVADDKDSDIPKGMNSKFVENVVDREAVIEVDKDVYAVFNKNGDVTVISTGEVFTEVEDSSDTSTTYEKKIGDSEVDLIVKLIMVSGKATGATFEREVDDVIDGTTVTTKFLDAIIDEGLAFMGGKTIDRTDLSSIQGNLSVSGEIFYPSVNFGWKSGLPNNFVSYDLTTGIFLYQHTDPAGVQSFPSRITVDPSTGLGTLKVDAGNTRDVKFEDTP